jgi:phosphoribosylamine--glycine ligase
MRRKRPCPGSCNVLLIGGGGREHALAWQLRKSPRLGTLWLNNPGNAGLAKLGKPCPHPFNHKNLFQLQRWLEKADIDLIIVGPETPLAEGIVDLLQTEKTLVFGPTKAAARLESDKAFAKTTMRQASIPTAEGRVFDNVEFAREYLAARDEPCVVKAAGLAGGKGAIVCQDTAEAREAVETIMVQRAFGEAGDQIIIEDKLSGQEISMLALVDGRTIWMLDPCQDHKQVGEGDVGQNTGGMGAYCPTPLIDEALLHFCEREVMVPAVDALRRDGIEYRGVLYAGLMLTPAGPKVLEFNCRFGDPECQALMARFDGDLLNVIWSTCTGALANVEFGFSKEHAVCVSICSAGYPGAYEKGLPITGIAEAEALTDEDGTVTVFHAGTTINHNGVLVTAGGRVLSVTATAKDLSSARDLANAACAKIHFDGAFHRTDIGDRVLVKQ